jgi:outer membrane biosynthesis protein TonB
LLLAVDVNSSGEATAVSVMSSPDDRLTQYAAGVLMKAKYKPARCNGAPCAMEYPVRFLMKAD